MMLMHNGFFTPEELRNVGFLRIGHEVKVSRLASIYGAKNISIGDYSRIDDFTVISAAAPTTIEAHVHIANHCTIIAHAELTFEKYSGISAGVRIYTASDDYSGNAMTNPTNSEFHTNVRKAPVKLSRHAIVGANTVILPGVTIGEGAAVGACSLVKESLEPWGIYAGVPAKLIKARNRICEKMSY